ncbi:MAG: Phosphocarrier protein HPr [Planctomycetes bacterium]|nr:Phosphocarrier protein HPr [Planctomycetota bacterium]
MSATTAGGEVVVRNAQGLHLRPATEFAKLAMATGCRVQVRTDAGDANGASVLELAMLGITQGVTLRITAEGPSAGDAVRRLIQLVESGFVV